MKRISFRILTVGAIAFLMAFCYYFTSAPARAGVLDNSYDELAAQFPDYISTLTANGATEGQIRAFVGDLDAALQGKQLTEDNFFRNLRATAIQTALKQEHSDVASAILKAYGSDILRVDDENEMPAFFKPLYTVLKEKLLSGPASPPTGGPSAGGPAAPPDPEPSADITVPVSGGTFTIADGQAGIIVPAGALSQEATIKIVLVTNPIPDPKMSFASNVYEFTSSEAFNSAVTVVLKYDPDKVADPGKLGVYYYNEKLGQWIYLGGAVDPDAGTVSVQVDHFTQFAVLINPAKVKLTDISLHWGYKYIDRLVRMGIISGYEDSTFRPDRTISRAEFATIITKAGGLAPDSQTALTFSDAESIPGWARPAIAAAVQAGIISGYEDNTFRPDRQITRAELATMIVRAMNISPAASPELTFSDAGDIPAWAKGYVATAVDEGIIAGRPDNTFGAGDNATRAEAATMAVKMLEAPGN